MWIQKLTIVSLLLSSAVLAQDERPNAGVRRLLFRRPRPRPKLASVADEDGVQEGRPVPFRGGDVPAGVPVDQLLRNSQDRNTAQLLEAALTEEAEDVRFSRPSRPRPAPQRSNDALESLFATAREPEIEEQEPILPLAPEPEPAPRPRPQTRTRQPPSVPRRRPRPRARPQSFEEDDFPRRAQEGDRGSRLPSRPREEEPVVGTVERYSHKNEDGSFTFGYMSEDGSFREETRGVDCITRGKYGYIDPTGMRREFEYTSGLPCDIGEEDDGLVDEDNRVGGSADDPIDPSERFRTAQAVQLSDEEIPVAARPRLRRPESADRVRGPPRRRPQGNAFNNLVNIAAEEEEELTLAPTPRPRVTPRPAPRRPAARPASRPVSRPRPASFDFDSELDDFTLNRPALTFDEQSRQQAGADKPVGPSFSSELVFNPDSGTFQTELRQNIRGSGEIRQSNPNAPAARRPPPTPTATLRPTASPTPRRTFAATPLPTRRPTPTAPRQPSFTAFNQPASRPTPSSGGALKFEPLSFPDPVAPSPSPTPTARARPTPTQPARPVTPVTPTAPRIARPQPTAAVRPASPTPTAANSLFFQPGTPRAPTPTAARPVTPAAPTAIRPANTFTLQPQPQRNVQPRPPPPQPFQQPRPAVAQPRPAQPQIQFGFTPLNQQRPQQNAAPFTAFSQGTPPQLRGAPPPQFGAPPQQFQQRGPPQQFVARPPAPQARPPAPGQQQFLGVPPQLQQGGRFQQFNRPPPGAQPAGQFSVFNPNQLRGA